MWVIGGGGEVVDEVASYAGLRSIAIDGKAIKLNGEVVFQRLVLDQGYYPDGIMTAPSDEALRRDIELALEAGFNGARLHQKVFEERFLYHADRMGYLVWGEFGDWGCRHSGPLSGEHQRPGPDYITQWLEVLERDYSHPSIVGWCPLNETWQSLTDRITTLDDVTRGMYLAAKAMDTTRPVLDASGYAHRVVEADIYDSHDYTQDPERFRERHAGLARGEPYLNSAESWGVSERLLGDPAWSLPYRGQPYFVGEFGGIRISLRARTPGATVSGLRASRSSTTASRGSALCCSTTPICSVTAIPSSPTSTRSRTGSTSSIAAGSSIWGGSAAPNSVLPPSRGVTVKPGRNRNTLIRSLVVFSWPRSVTPRAGSRCRATKPGS